GADRLRCRRAAGGAEGRMSVFGRYARYYDACYADKDYAAECDFLEAAFARFGRRPATLLDLACGTGAHGLILAARGYALCGVDRSAGMLAGYRDKANAAGLAAELHEQDFSHLALGRRFDGAICMGDAVGYLPETADVLRFFTRVRHHLRDEGVFV